MLADTLIDIRRFRIHIPVPKSECEVRAVDQIPSTCDGWTAISYATDCFQRPLFGGNFFDKNWWNIPGPFYGAMTDTCETGPLEAPANVMMDDEGQEFVFRQPTNVVELRGVIRAAYCDPFNGYGADGDNHWTLELIREWWRHRDDMFARQNELLQTNKSVDAWVRFMSTSAEDYLRRYSFFIEKGKLPEDTDHLPEL